MTNKTGNTIGSNQMSTRLRCRRWTLPTLFCILALSMMLPGGTVCAQDGSASRSLHSGNGFLNRGLYDLAITEYRQFLQAYPDHEQAATARYGLAVSLFRLSKHGEALPELEQLAQRRRFEFATEVVMISGQCHLALGSYPEAATAFESVVDGSPDHELADDAAALRIEALYRAKQLDDIDATGRMMLQRWSGSPMRERAELFWGLADMARERYTEAARRFTGMRARFEHGEFAEQTVLLLAQSLHRSDELQEAVDRYQQVIETDNDAYVPDALYGLALLLQPIGRLDPATQLLDELIRQYPDHALLTDARLLLGRVLFDDGKYDKARGPLTHVVRAGGPLTDDAAYWLAKCDLRQDKVDAAAAGFAAALQNYPQSNVRPEMTYDMAVALLRGKNDDAALPVLEGFREAFPKHALAPDALNLMAVTEHQQQRFKRSAELCEDFIKQYPQDPARASIMFLLAENAFLGRQFGSAAAGYRQFLERFPEDAQATNAQYRLGMSLYQRKEFNLADPLLDGIVAGRETPPERRMALMALGDSAFQSGAWADAQRYLSDYLSFGTDQPASDDALLKLALSLHRQNTLDAAVQTYSALIEGFPDSLHRLQAIFERGQALVTLGDDERAANDFESTLSEKDRSRFTVPALNHLGAIAMRRNDYLAAAGYYERLSEAQGKPVDRAEALYQQGQAFMAAQDFGNAGAVFERLIEGFASSERTPAATALLSIALARQGKHAQSLQVTAVAEREHVRRLDASLLTAMIYEKAWCLRELKKNDDAAGAYRTLLEIPGKHDLKLYTRLELAELESRSKRYQPAAELLSDLYTIARNTPDDVPGDLRSQVGYQLGVCQYHLKEFDKAADTLGRFIDAFPQSPHMASASLLAGESLINLGRHQEAVAHLGRIVRNHADEDACPPALLRLGDSLAVLQEWEQSQQAFAAYLGRFSETPLWYQARFGEGWALENRGAYDDAMTVYRSVVDRHKGPTAARAQFQIGECLYAKGEFDAAVRELLKVDILYAYPEWSAAALFEAGRCFVELYNPLQARTQFQTVIEKYSETQWAAKAADQLETLTASSLPGH